MPSDKQRRQAARRHLERQTRRRREREVRRRRLTLIASVAGTVVLIAAVVATVVLLGGGSDNTSHPQAGSASLSAAAAKEAAQATQRPKGLPPTPIPAATGRPVTFRGVTVTGAKDIEGQPTVTSTGGDPPSHLVYKDLVVGTGKKATSRSTVSVQYIGAVYKSGTVFNNSYASGAPAPFSLQKSVGGFARGIAGGKGVPPMKVGGRRLLIVPPDLAYGASPPPGSHIPKNATLIFLVDLKKVS